MLANLEIGQTATSGSPDVGQSVAIWAQAILVQDIKSAQVSTQFASVMKMALRLLWDVPPGAVNVVDTVVSLDRSVQEGVVEWLEPVRLEPQEVVLPIKEEIVDVVQQRWRSEKIIG